MKTWMKQDPQVQLFLGIQKPDPGSSNALRLSQYTLPVEKNGRYFLFSVLTRQFVELTAEEQMAVCDPAITLADLSDHAVSFLYENYFLVQEGLDETERYKNLLALLRMKQRSVKGQNMYIILPTTGCNARCTYCYEEGWKPEHMSEETAEAAVDYIDRTRSKGKIRVSWFGGEPLLGIKAIDHIAKGLEKRGIDFASNIVTNGSLFSDELVSRVRKDWHLDQAQITLDGMPDWYDKRKCYCDQSKSMFGKVIQAIHRLQNAGIIVMLRLNYDCENLESVYELIDYLDAEFPDKTNLVLYPVLLHQEQAKEGNEDLWEASGQMIRRARDKGFGSGLIAKSKLKTHYCFADDYNHASAIDPKGSLFKCEKCALGTSYGSIFEDAITDKAAWAEITEPNQIRDKCRDCMFLPECTDFDKCPNLHADCRKMNEVLITEWLDYLIAHEEYMTGEKKMMGVPL